MNLRSIAFALLSLLPLTQAQGIVAEIPPTYSFDFRFGRVLDVQGDRAVVAIDSFYGGVGRVTVYERQGTDWVLTQELDPGIDPGGLDFGMSVDMEGDLLAVGATGYQGDRGAVFLYRLQGTSWALEEILSPPSLTPFDRLGVSVDLDGDRLAVGLNNNGNGPKIMVFGFLSPQWSLMTTLEAPPNGGSSSGFGSVLALGGDQLFVGASGTSSPGVYRYREVGGVWLPQGKLMDSNGATASLGGAALALEGDRLLVGSPGYGPSGAVFAFRETVSGWVQEGPRLRIPGASDLTFGFSLALRGSTAVIGAPYEDGAADQSGAIYTFQRDGNSYRPTGRFVAPDPEYLDRFGWAVAFDGDTVMASRPTNVDSKPVAVLQVPGHSIPYGTCLPDHAVCGNPDPVSGCGTSLGVGCNLRALGSGSVTLDDLQFEIAPLAPGQFGLLYMGGAATSVPFGDGLGLVASGGAGLFRFPVRSSGTLGSITEGPGVVGYAAQAFGSAGAIEPGSTWLFQGWFRDPNGPCGTGFNLTPGLSVRFLP